METVLVKAAELGHPSPWPPAGVCERSPREEGACSPGPWVVELTVVGPVWLPSHSLDCGFLQAAWSL